MSRQQNVSFELEPIIFEDNSNEDNEYGFFVELSTSNLDKDVNIGNGNNRNEN